MHERPHVEPTSVFAGWGGRLGAALSGAAGGALLGLAIPGGAAASAGRPDVPLWLVAPFVVLLLSIALMPFISASWWHKRYPEVALALGGLVAGYCVVGFRGVAGHHGPWGGEAVLHAATEYYAFLALVGGLYVVSGGIVVDLRARGRPGLNTALLAAGALLANIVGTTGASVLLIRPFMRINRGRLRATHIVFFIFAVSNCGGCLSPVGDPPLYLGYIKNVPFWWDLSHLWTSWLLVMLPLLAIFYAYDRWAERHATRAEEIVDHRFYLGVRGTTGLVALALIIGGVFIDPLLGPRLGLAGVPVGATFQVLVALAALRLAPAYAHEANAFTFGPLKEVGLLFAGIFMTMIPALAYLAQHGHSLGIDSPAAFYFASGALSSVLDNAPTYLNFLQLPLGEQEMSREAVRALLAEERGNLLLDAISTGAVFFGALTYIGNGPNFMVKAIAEQHGVRMPSFFGYVGIACVALLPVLVLHGIIRFVLVLIPA